MKGLEDLTRWKLDPNTSWLETDNNGEFVRLSDVEELLAGQIKWLREQAILYRREEEKTKGAEKADRASGKLEPGHTYEATWNYYQGLWKAYDNAADTLTRTLMADRSNLSQPDGGASGEGELATPQSSSLTQQDRERLREIAALISENLEGVPSESVTFLRDLSNRSKEEGAVTAAEIAEDDRKHLASLRSSARQHRADGYDALATETEHIADRLEAEWGLA